MGMVTRLLLLPKIISTILDFFVLCMFALKGQLSVLYHPVWLNYNCYERNKEQKERKKQEKKKKREI